MFVSGQAYAMKHGKARQQRNAEVMLVAEADTGATAGVGERPAEDREGCPGEAGKAPGPGAAGAMMTTRTRSDAIPGCWRSSDPEKVQYRASYGLFFRPIGAKNLGFSTGGEGLAL